MRNPDADAVTIAVRLRNIYEIENLRKVNAAMRWRLEQQDERAAKAKGDDQWTS